MASIKKQTTVPYLKFPMQFEENKLVTDLSLLLDRKWTPHFNTRNYEGEWKVIPLYAPKGDEENIFAVQVDQALPMETPLLRKCSYFKEVIDSFKCTILSARILNLSVGANIKTHTDHELGYEDGTFRLHIPITTNDKVEFILNGEQLTMLPGECWYTNVNYPHSVANKGTHDRIHLVIDGERNEWSDQLFFAMASEEDFVAPPEEYSPEVMQQMIESLQHNDTPAAAELIQELKAKLASSQE